MCRWAVIDIDDYSLDVPSVVKDVRKMKFPLVPCLSKSGGLHLFLFLKDWETADSVQALMKKIAASLGFANSEIFPKQKAIRDRDQLGSWLNLPYHGETRLALSDDGVRKLSLAKFLDLSEKMKTTVNGVRFESPKSDKSGSGELSDGPPCLETLVRKGFPKGTRNRGLFNLGVFAKKSSPDGWKEMIEEFNRTVFENPLPAEEVSSMISSLRKKDYQFTCQESPICEVCDSTTCQTRKFGIGAGENAPRIDGISKVESEPPIWFIDVQGERLELTTTQLLNFRMFQEVAVEKMSVVFPPVKPAVWTSLVASAMEDLITIEASPEMSVRGEFLEHLNDFLFDRHELSESRIF